MRCNIEQDRQFTYCVILRGVHITVVAVKEQYVLHILIVFSLHYPARNAHAPYFIVICDLPGCNKFFRIISYTTTFSGGKKKY